MSLNNSSYEQTGCISHMTYRARDKDCWPGCPLDHQVNFPGCLEDFLVVRILGQKTNNIYFSK